MIGETPTWKMLAVCPKQSTALIPMHRKESLREICIYLLNQTSSSSSLLQNSASPAPLLSSHFHYLLFFLQLSSWVFSSALLISIFLWRHSYTCKSLCAFLLLIFYVDFIFWPRPCPTWIQVKSYLPFTGCAGHRSEKNINTAASSSSSDLHLLGNWYYFVLKVCTEELKSKSLKCWLDQ